MEEQIQRDVYLKLKYFQYARAGSATISSTTLPTVRARRRHVPWLVYQKKTASGVGIGAQRPGMGEHLVLGIDGLDLQLAGLIGDE